MSRLERFLQDAAEDTWKVSEEFNQKITCDKLKGITKSDSGINFVEIDFGQVNYCKKLYNLKGNIPFLNPIESYIFPSCEEINFVINWVRDFFITNEIIFEHENEKLRKLKAVSHSAFLGFNFWCPNYIGKNNKVHKDLWTVILLSLVWMLDDIFEEVEFNDINDEQKAKVAKICENYSLEDVDLEIPDYTPGILIPYIKGYKLVKEAKAKYQEDQPNQPVLSHKFSKMALCNGLVSAFALHSIDWDSQLGEKPASSCNGKVNTNEFKRERRIQIPEKAFLRVKRIDTAALGLLEHILIVKNIALEEQIRENLWSIHLAESSLAIAEYCNAIVGIICDLKKDQISSITFKMRRKGYSLGEAFHEVIQELEEEMKEFLHAKSELMITFPDSKELYETINITERMIDYAGYLMMYTFRYNDIQYAFVK